MSPLRPVVMSSTTCPCVTSDTRTSAATRPRYSAQIRSASSGAASSATTSAARTGAAGAFGPSAGASRRCRGSPTRRTARHPASVAKSVTRELDVSSTFGWRSRAGAGRDGHTSARSASAAQAIPARRAAATQGESGDGAGIDRVEFFVRESGYSHTERTAGYCIFQGGEPSCRDWPRNALGQLTWGNGGAVVVNGDYNIDVSVFPKEETFISQCNWTISLTIDVP